MCKGVCTCYQLSHKLKLCCIQWLVLMVSYSNREVDRVGSDGGSKSIPSDICQKYVPLQDFLEYPNIARNVSAVQKFNFKKFPLSLQTAPLVKHATVHQQNRINSDDKIKMVRVATTFQLFGWMIYTTWNKCKFTFLFFICESLYKC